jgi:hypothetical protein
MEKMNLNLEVVEFDFDEEQLEEVVTPGSGFGCD